MLVIVSLLIGVGLGVLVHPNVPASLAPYLPMAVMAALDSVFGGLRARFEGTFNDRVFVVSFLSNAVLAALLVWAGNRLGVADMSIAVVVVFVIVFPFLWIFISSFKDPENFLSLKLSQAVQTIKTGQSTQSQESV